MPQQTQALYEFGPFSLNPAQQLLVEGTKKISLTPKAFQTLLVLVESQGQIETKEELLQKVWPDAFVEEATLAQNVFTLRKQLRDDRETALYIETVPKRGYRFVAEVREVKTPTAPVPPRYRFARHTMRYAVVVLVVMLLAALAGWYWTQWKTTSEHAAQVTPRPATLAVLPFRGLSDNDGDESWGVGMTDAIITRLTSL